MNAGRALVLTLVLCLLLAATATQGQAQAGERDCFQRLGAIGIICRVPGAGPTIEIQGISPDGVGRLLLRVSQFQVDAARPAGLVASTPDGRVTVRVWSNGHVTVSMGPSPEGKLHHVTLEHNLYGRVIGTVDSAGPAPVVPETVDSGAGQGVIVYRQDAQADGSVIHVVRPGEFLGAIARAYGIRQQEIIDFNGLTNLNVLHVGQELLIQPARPALPEACQAWEPVVHVVRRGENVTRIARQFGVHPESLAIRNGLPHKGRLLHAGHNLVIPDLWARDGEVASLPADCTPVGAVIHVVRAGHTLNAIALAYGVEPAALIERNRLEGGGRWLRPGQRLVIQDAPAMAAEAGDDAEAGADADPPEEESSAGA